MTHIIDTGERILLEKESPLMIARHFCAYKFAKDFVYNKAVLDIGCGEGYGSFHLAGFAKEVVAIDYDRAIVDYARNKYRADNLTFNAINIKDLSSVGKKFDIACSFHVIEHLAETAGFLDSVKFLLNPDGVFICSTPNKLDASPHSETPLNRFHLREYLLDEFRELLKRYFNKVNMFGLKRGNTLNFYRMLKKSGLFNFLPGDMNPVKRFYERIDCDNFNIVDKRLATALDFIAVCSD